MSASLILRRCATYRHSKHLLDAESRAPDEASGHQGASVDAIIHLDIAIDRISSMELSESETDFEECSAHVRQLHVAVCQASLCHDSA